MGIQHINEQYARDVLKAFLCNGFSIITSPKFFEFQSSFHKDQLSWNIEDDFCIIRRFASCQIIVHPNF